MPVSQLIGRGIGFNPGSVEFIVTHGLGAGEPTAPVQLGNLGFGDRSGVRRRAREWERERRKRWDGQSREEIARDLAIQLGLIEEAATPLAEAAAQAVEALTEPFQTSTALDFDAMLQDRARLDALIGALGQLQAEIEAQRDEEAIVFLLFSE